MKTTERTTFVKSYNVNEKMTILEAEILDDLEELVFWANQPEADYNDFIEFLKDLRKQINVYDDLSLRSVERMVERYKKFKEENGI